MTSPKRRNLVSLVFTCLCISKALLIRTKLESKFSANGTEMHSSRKNPYPPHGRSLEIPRGRGVLEVKILEAKYKAKLEFPEGGGGGVQSKKPSVREVWIYSGTAQFPFQSVRMEKVEYHFVHLIRKIFV